MHTGTIVGIDPGSTNLGVGVLVIDLDTYQIVSTKAYTIHADKSDLFKEVAETHSDKFRRLKALEEHLLDAFNCYLPFLVASEAPFYNRFRPNAYGVLVEVISVIQNALWRYSEKIPLVTIDPPTVKKGIGALKQKGKDPMREAMSKMTNLNIEQPLDDLDEHSIDAIAVAYSAYKQYLGEHLT